MLRRLFNGVRSTAKIAAIALVATAFLGLGASTASAQWGGHGYGFRHGGYGGHHSSFGHGSSPYYGGGHYAPQHSYPSYGHSNYPSNYGFGHRYGYGHSNFHH